MLIEMGRQKGGLYSRTSLNSRQARRYLSCRDTRPASQACRAQRLRFSRRVASARASRP